VIVLDQRGRRCPLPVIALAKAVAAAPVGELVAVAATDPAAAVDIPAWCRMRGHAYEGATTDPDGTPVHRVRKR
jgi:tRNA 2-thiouridine synthesizing protein A